MNGDQHWTEKRAGDVFEPLMVRLTTAALLLDTPYETLRSWIRAGKLRATKKGGNVYILRAELERFAQEDSP